MTRVGRVTVSTRRAHAPVRSTLSAGQAPRGYRAVRPSRSARSRRESRWRVGVACDARARPSSLRGRRALMRSAAARDFGRCATLCRPGAPRRGRPYGVSSPPADGLAGFLGLDSSRRWAPAPARGAAIAPERSPPVVGGLSPTRASSSRSGTLTGHGVSATGGRDARGGATVAGVRRGRDGARGRVAHARAGGPCGVPGAGRLQRDRRRELPARQPAQRVGRPRRRRHEHPGLRDRHQRQPRRDGQLQDQDADATDLPASTSTGWATTAATARARSRPSARRRRCRRPSRPA